MAEKELEIKRLTEQNDVIRVANHNITHRLATLERSVIELSENAQSLNCATEIGEELAPTLENIKCLSSEYHDEIHRIKEKNFTFHKNKDA